MDKSSLRQRQIVARPGACLSAAIVASAVSVSTFAEPPVATGNMPRGGTPAYSLFYVCKGSPEGGNGCIGPSGPLIQAADGNFYGTSSGGGDFVYWGTVFRLTPQGEFSLLHSFSGDDGNGPLGGVVQASNGDFYGVTFAYPAGGGWGPGSIYRVSPSDDFSTLHVFTGFSGAAMPDGGTPNGPLIQASNGDLYGTTRTGGFKDQGTVFRISPDGVYKMIDTFDSNAPAPTFNGAYPTGPLTQGRDGFLYGTTEMGGRSPNCAPPGCGTVFRIDLEGRLLAWASLSEHEGAAPSGALLEAADGRMYGTTRKGGWGCSHNGCGTIFSFDPAGGSIRLEYKFAGPDGSYVAAGLIQASDGNFYGAARDGGFEHSFDCRFSANGCGTLFRLTPEGSLTILHRFHSGNDAASPDGTLLQGRDGALYGPAPNGAYYNGDGWSGAVYRWQLPAR
jgi:uncharacterized repeat protein (TIGR03803 family)